MAFPLAPTNGQQYTDPLARSWVYTLAVKQWNIDNSADTKGNNYAATVAPIVTNDNTQGYQAGSHWVDTLTNKAYVNMSSATGAANWVELSSLDGFPQLAADPTTPALGDVWYNTSTNVYKGYNGLTKIFTQI